MDGMYVSMHLTHLMATPLLRQNEEELEVTTSKWIAPVGDFVSWMEGTGKTLLIFVQFIEE